MSSSVADFSMQSAPGAVRRPGPLFSGEVGVSSNRSVPACPHCGNALVPFELPEMCGWDAPFQLACFNDDCPYYVRGWTWMEEKYGVRSSYRHRLDPATGTTSPLPVWSPTAIRDRILEADVDVAGVGDTDVIPGEDERKGNKT